MPGPSLLDHFAALADPRQSCKVLFPLPELLLLVPCGTLAGAEDFVEIRRWRQMSQAFLEVAPFSWTVCRHGGYVLVRAPFLWASQVIGDR